MEIKLVPPHLFRSVGTEMFMRPIRPLAEACAPIIMATLDMFEKIIKPAKKGLRNDTAVVFLREETQEEERGINGILLTCRRVHVYRLNKANNRKLTEIRRTYSISGNYCWVSNKPRG